MRNIDYEIIRSRRKTCSIELTRELKVIVRSPLLMPKYKIDIFVKEKQNWIIKNLEKLKLRQEALNKISPLTQNDIDILKIKARKYIPSRVEYFASIMGVEYEKIHIKCQKTVWGSCSSKQNLNFNCLLMLTPNDVIDYVVVHELCHIKQMNHSNLFWQEVEKVIPNYMDSYNWLKVNGPLIINRVEKNK